MSASNPIHPKDIVKSLFLDERWFVQSFWILNNRHLPETLGGIR